VSKNLIPAQRRKRIQELLEKHQVVQSVFLSEALQVSEATIRRDLGWLEKEGLLERTHGGAILSQRMEAEPEYSHSAQAHPNEKQAIGVAAAALVENGDTIFINSGTTATQVVHHLRGKSGITIVTSNINAALEMREFDLELILLGGIFRPRAKSVVGRFTTDSLRQIYANKAFIGVDGLSLKYGCTTPISDEAEIARLMIERTHGPVIVVADHSKWGVVSNFEIAPLDQIQILVTDEGLNAKARAELASRSVEVLIATVQPSPNGQSGP
jgi:DeoR/GlpR family transcriptional regulator of sugar metabolism